MTQTGVSRNKYLVFARKWRPQSFEQVVGQEHITRTLQNSIAAGRLGHAFLFIGSRGIGKTTTARILAKALNCAAAEAPTPHPCGQCDNCRSIAEGNNIDVIEIDGASNNSVDDVREIRENVRLVPSRSRYKVYIIDEVHQLSAGAFNALLKTLEEPPPHAVFILATTEAHKLPATIISRCQRFDFRRVPVEQIVKLLRDILEQEGIEAGDDALQAIARAAEGGIRDAESILDQLVSYCDGEIRFDDVYDVLGLVDWRVMHDLCDAIAVKDVVTQLRIIAAVVDAGKDLSQFVQEILRYFRNLLVCKSGGASELLALPEDEIGRIQARADKFTLTNLIRLVEQFAELTKGFDSQAAQRIAIEALLIRISKRTVEMSVDAVIEKLAQLGEAGAGNVTMAPHTASEEAEPPVTRPAPGSPVEVTDANLHEVWPRIVDRATAQQLSLRVGLEQARPVQVFGETIILQFDGAMAEAAKMIEKPHNRKTIEAAIRALTANVVSFQCAFNNGQPDTQNEQVEGRNATPVAGRVSKEDARTAMSDPHITQVIDTFKGKIVDIRKE